MRKVLVGLVCVLALGTWSVAAASQRRLVPAPGTGHGVLTGDPPQELTETLSYEPGFGGGPCAGLPEPEQFVVYGDGFGSYTRLAVGAQMFMCVGSFAAHDVHVTITSPRGDVVTLPSRTFTLTPAKTFLELRILPSPPHARLLVENDSGAGRGVLVAQGPLRGDGSGRYRVQLSAGALRKQQSFTLHPAPLRRLINPLSNYDTVQRGGHLEFDTAGEPALGLFHVLVFGPEEGLSTHQLRTDVVGRADSHGEAIVRLDIAGTSETGTYCARLEPYPPSPPTESLDPQLSCFEVA